MSPFSIFAIFYMTAFLLEMVEKWEYPRFTLAFFVLITIIVFAKITRINFLIFLVLTTAYFLFFRFPEVANHVNLMIYCNFVMIFGMIYSFIRPRYFTSDHDYYDMLKPVLRISLILVYFLAGFHKLNGDFFNPEVSCAGAMLYGLLSMIKLHIFDISIVLSPLIVIATGVLVIFWEIIGGFLLFFPKIQIAILLFSWTMHSVLAMIGFVDFSALAFSLLLTFIPSSYYQVINNYANIYFGTIRINRVHIYFIINAIGGIFSGINSNFDFYPLLTIKFISGIFFNFASFIFIMPILSMLFLPSSRPAWVGVPVLNKKMPKFMLVFPVFLFLYGMTPYLGLRTAGNFSMFSNLRTEGKFSNHLLLRSNPLKIWDYQEDVVRFIEIDDERAQIGHKYLPLKGNELPVVEFKKLIYKWTKAGYTVPLTFEYQGKIYTTEDIVKIPRWRTDKRNWEMILMDFRIIQPDREKPNQCRW